MRERSSRYLWLSHETFKAARAALAASSLAALAVLGACADGSVASDVAGLRAPQSPNNVVGVVGILNHQVEVCVDLASDPTAGPYTISTVQDPTPSPELTDQVFSPLAIAVGDCETVFLRGTTGNVLIQVGNQIVNPRAEVFITPTVPAGYTATVSSCITEGPTNWVNCTNVNSVMASANVFHGSSITFLFTAAATVDGRMTGGGNQVVLAGDVKITRGLTLHCDILLSNNLEINWGRNKWHLDKPILTAECLDNPNIAPYPPDAPFDTFIGTAVGKLNGVDGSRIEFTFVDAGEPGTSDKAAVKIWNSSSEVVLDLPLGLLTRGNLQAHYDQPHQ